MLIIRLQSILNDNHEFSSFGYEHLSVVTLFAVIGVAVISYAVKKLNPEERHTLGIYMSLFILIIVIITALIKVGLGVFDSRIDLPFALCNISAVIIPVMTIQRKYLLYEVLYFWILGGTLQAVLTPDLEHSFPHYQFIQYWTVHAGLVVLILYYTIAIGWRPTMRSLFKSMIAVHIYAFFIAILNYVTGSNHMFLCSKPANPSILDLFGDWPWYLIIGEVVGFLLFLLVYSPFFFIKKKEI